MGHICCFGRAERKPRKPKVGDPLAAGAARYEEMVKRLVPGEAVVQHASQQLKQFSDQIDEVLRRSKRDGGG